MSRGAWLLGGAAVGLGVIAVFVAFLYVVSRIPFGKAMRSLAPLMAIALICALLNLFVDQSGETLFKWVGPIASEDWVLLARADSPIQLSSLEQAKQYRLGGYKGDAPTNKVVESGLEVQQSLYDKENPERLAKGQIDLWVTSSVAGQYLARQQGYQDFRVVLTFGRGDLYLALNQQTTDATVDKLRAALEQLRSEGALQGVMQKY